MVTENEVYFVVGTFFTRRGETGLGGKTSELLSWVAGTPGKIF
jgi:hypothetical protein